ncbi:E3 ubiquitin-protein ligase RNF4 isoform X2 [Balaenoptera acutorostrata]|uniref:E3 ubiquitin-protein ligase RNF4 isoform X2 n=1 Tax=Balaenoptera acutorostrata TaxID=9767 RepID=A0ABM3TKH2_BALAC|nr:E3 ubiquitin-protein ligase RNF4 isoform X2 [Balaenoptera acutorostrata]
MSTRKRRGGTVNSRQAQKRTREASSPPEMALEAEPIELVESAGDEIVDLTCESLEPVVVDLTHSDSVVISITRALLDLSKNQLLALWILSLKRVSTSSEYRHTLEIVGSVPDHRSQVSKARHNRPLCFSVHVKKLFVLYCSLLSVQSHIMTLCIP